MTLNIELHPERLVQPHSGELGGAVVHQLVGAAVTRQAGYIDQVALAINILCTSSVLIMEARLEIRVTHVLHFYRL